MKTITTLILAGFAALAVPAMGFANEPGEGGPGDHEMMARHEGHMKEMCKELNLTPDQQKQLDANKETRKAQMKAAVQQMKQQQEALRVELQKEPLDMAKITQIQNDLKSAQAQMIDQRLAGILEVRKILTPEQFKKFEARMEEHKDHFKGKHGKKNKDKKDEKDEKESR